MHATRIAAALCIGSAALVHGQGVTLRGVVYDSLHARPLAGALVGLTGSQRTATTDSAGRFVIGDVAPGSYRITAQHDAIDRLGMSAVGAQVRVTDGQDPVRVAIPSFAGLWKTVCGPTPPASDTGFIFGSVRRADGGRGRTVVAASWRDIASNGRTIVQKQKTLEIDADSLGNYTLCGVPTLTGVTIQAIAESAESGLYDLDPLDRQRIVRRDLTLGTPLEQVVERKRGARLSGTVVADSNGGPLANAKVALTDLGLETTTNEKGEYQFADLIPGSHTLYVRRIGYGETETRIDFEEAETRRHNVVLGRITLLDSMMVVGKPLAREEAMRVFEENRRIGLGQFITREELAKAGDRPLRQLLSGFRGIRFSRGGDTPFTNRGIKSFGQGLCAVTIFLDGVRTDSTVLRDMKPEMLAGVEWYPGAGSIPPEYLRLGTQCGVLALHSRYKLAK